MLYLGENNRIWLFVWFLYFKTNFLLKCHFIGFALSFSWFPASFIGFQITELGLESKWPLCCGGGSPVGGLSEDRIIAFFWTLPSEWHSGLWKAQGSVCMSYLGLVVWHMLTGFESLAIRSHFHSTSLWPILWVVLWNSIMHVGSPTQWALNISHLLHYQHHGDTCFCPLNFFFFFFW